MTKRYIKIVAFFFIAIFVFGYSEATDDSTKITVELEQINSQNIGSIIEIALVGRGAIRDLAWSSDGNQLAVASSTGVWIFNPNREDNLPIRLGKHDFTEVVYSPDGKLLAASSSDRGFDATGVPIIYVWSTDDYELTNSFELVAGAFSLAFNPDSSVLVAGNGRRIISLWDIEAGQLISSIDNADVLPAVLTFQPNSNLFVAAGIDARKLRFWSVDALKEDLQAPYASETRSLDQPVRLVAFAASSNLMAIVVDSTLSLLEVESLNEIASYTDPRLESASEIAFSPNEMQIAISSQSITVWNVSDIVAQTEIEPLFEFEGYFFDFSPDGSELTVATQSALSFVNLVSGATRNIAFNNLCSQFDNVTVQTHEIHISGCNQEVFYNLSMTENQAVYAQSTPLSGIEYFWDYEEEMPYNLQPINSPCTSINIIWPESLLHRPIFQPILSPARDLVVFGSFDGIYFWNTNTGELLNKLITSDSEHLFFSKDGTLLFSYGRENVSLRVWGVPSG